MSSHQLSHILHSLIPRTAEEMSLLKSVLASARAMHRRVYGDLGLSILSVSPHAGLAAAYSASDELLSAIPASDKRYFDGLVEALEVYHSIHGEGVPVETLSAGDLALRELRRIRDHVLESGLGIF